MNKNPKLQLVGNTNAAYLLSTEEKPIEWIFEGWLSKSSINVMYAKQGAGKSYFALALAHSLAKGKDYMGFKCSDKQSVVYFDMENDPSIAHMRNKQIDAGNYGDFKGKDFRLIRKNNYELVPNLRDHPSCNVYLRDSEGFDVVVIDNLKAAAYDRSGRDDEIVKWNDAQKAIDLMTKRGQCVVLMHHENKLGEVAGSQRILDVASTVVHLEKIYFQKPDGSALKGTRLSMEKGRALEDDNVVKFLEWKTSENNDSICWESKDMDGVYLQIMSEYNLKKPDQVMKSLHVSYYKANYLLSRAANTITVDNYTNDEDEWEQF